MLKPPVPNARINLVENCKPTQLLEFFEACMKTGPKGAMYGLLPDAWGRLFSDLYFSPVELTDAMAGGAHPLGEEREEMLRQFIKVDRPNGGTFVLKVIEKGGMIDRSALIMIADPGDLAKIETDGTTALHLLIKACDRMSRPMLITRAGPELLSRVYDRNGIPVLLFLFGLSDLDTPDLDAIKQVFSSEDLKKVKAKNQMGRNALEILTEIAKTVGNKPVRGRNAFSLNSAVKTTNPKGDATNELNPADGNSGVPAPKVTILRGSTELDGDARTVPTPRKNLSMDNTRVPAIGGISPLGPGIKAPGNAAAQDKQKSSVSPEDAKTPQKIMIVEDDPVILKLLQIRLENMGYEVVAMAESGDDAVKLARDKKIDISSWTSTCPEHWTGSMQHSKLKHIPTQKLFFSRVTANRK